MFKVLFSQNYSMFLDIPEKKASFNDGRFVSLLESITEYGAAGYLYNPGATRDLSATGYKREALPDQTMFNIKSCYFLQLDFVKTPKYRARFSTASSNADNDVFIGLLSDANGDTQFDFSSGLSINSYSQNKRLAWEFIKYMVSYDMQMSTMIYGLPVNVRAFEQRSRLFMTGEFYQFDDADAELDENGARELKDYISAVAGINGRIGGYLIKDESIDIIINSEVESYFSDGKPANEVADKIQNKVSLYINEG
jgi:multiple sugar transport system substrate-binding protein